MIDDTWDWNKEVVVVTGGSGGIGAGISQRLAALGAKVIVLDIIPLTFEPGIQMTLISGKEKCNSRLTKAVLKEPNASCTASVI